MAPDGALVLCALVSLRHELCLPRRFLVVTAPGAVVVLVVVLAVLVVVVAGVAAVEAVIASAPAGSAPPSSVRLW